MLKRKDLAKEFELVVQQEITNHNNSILATNVSLSEFRLELSELRDLIKTSKSYTDSISLELKQEIINKHSLLNANVANATVSADKKLCSIKSDLTQHESLLSSLEQTKGQISTVDEEIIKLGKIVSSSLDSLRATCDNLAQLIEQKHEQSNAKIFELSQRVDLAFCQSTSLEQALINKISTNAIDTDAMLKEMRTFRRETHVMEKHLEDIYTKIDRIKEKVDR